MFFDLFKKKYPTTVNPLLAATWSRQQAFPAVDTPPAAAHGTVRRTSLDGTMPRGVLQPALAHGSPASAHVLERGPDRPAIAVVTNHDAPYGTGLWEIDPAHPTRLAVPREVTFDAEQHRWVLPVAREVIGLPADRLLLLLSYHRPHQRYGLYLYDVGADQVSSVGLVEPAWTLGVPFRFVQSRQMRPDAVLVVYRTGQKRLGAMRYVHLFDHLLLFSPRHPDGVEVARIGVDDGNVHDWGTVGTTLWLATSDSRERPAPEFVWSVDLAAVL